MDIMKIRAIVSTLLIIIFLIVSLTGIGLYLSPNGKIARETGWNLFGFSKFKLENLHTVMGFAMVALILIHLGLNYKLYFAEVGSLLRGSAKKHNK